MTAPGDRIEKLTLVLPAFNEEAAIIPLLDRAVVALSLLRPFDIIVVDDGSRDATAERVRARQADLPMVRLVQHAQNRGLGPAIVTGLRAALEEGHEPGRLVVMMDADNTHPPESIGSMIEAAEAGADLVIASRFRPGSAQHGVPPLRMLMSWGARRLFRVTLNLPGVRDYTCGFRGFRASLLTAGFERWGEEGLITRRGFACTDELLINLATLKPRIVEVPFILRYDMKPGASKMKLFSTILETLKLIREHRARLRE